MGKVESRGAPPHRQASRLTADKLVQSNSSHLRSPPATGSSEKQCSTFACSGPNLVATLAAGSSIWDLCADLGEAAQEIDRS